MVVDKILGSVKTSICTLNPCPSQLLKSCNNHLKKPLTSIINQSLAQGTFSWSLEKVVICPLLKRYLYRNMMTNYCLISNLPFLGKCTEKIAADQFQVFLDNLSVLHSFQSSFRPGYMTAVALLALVNDLCLNEKAILLCCYYWIHLQYLI